MSDIFSCSNCGRGGIRGYHECSPDDVARVGGIAVSPSPERAAYAALLKQSDVRVKAHASLDALIDRGPEPEVPPHVCTLGVTECDGICVDWHSYSEVRRELDDAIREAQKEHA